MKVFVLMRSSGSWDDYHQWIDKICLLKEVAEERMIRKNAQIARLKAYSNTFSDDYEGPNWIRHDAIRNLGDFYIHEHETI